MRWWQTSDQIVESNVRANLEAVGLSVIGRLRDLGAEIADELGGVGRIFRVYPDQHAVEGRHRVHRRIGALAVTVEARRRIRRDHVGEGAAVFRGLSSSRHSEDRGANQRRPNRPSEHHYPFLVYLSSRTVAKS